jgi:hypothetical protein
MDVNNNNNAGNDASSTTSNKGNNVAIATTAKTPAHRQQRLRIGDGNKLPLGQGNGEEGIAD